MYVSVPKNYGGVAFKKEEKSPPALSLQKSPPKEEKSCEVCENCSEKQKNPLTCLFSAIRGREKSGLDSDDFLLIALIALLIGNEGSEDILLILAMLLLM